MTHGQPRAGRRRIAGYVDEDVYAELTVLREESGVTISRAVALALREWKDARDVAEGITPRLVEG